MIREKEQKCITVPICFPPPRHYCSVSTTTTNLRTVRQSKENKQIPARFFETFINY